jgi:hypothetical protein
MSAQSPTAAVVGIIRDASGAAVPGASVKVRNTDTNALRQAVSGEDGGFTITNLSPGRYEVLVEKTGFQALRETGLELQVNQTARLELQLQVGALSQAVEVQGQVSLLNTENAVRGDVIVTQEIMEMPLDGRNFQDLAFLVPGVQQNAEGDNAGPFAINGGTIVSAGASRSMQCGLRYQFSPEPRTIRGLTRINADSGIGVNPRESADCFLQVNLLLKKHEVVRLLHG